MHYYSFNFMKFIQNIYKIFSILLVALVCPCELFALPKEIKKIIHTLGRSKTKEEKKTKTDDNQSSNHEPDKAVPDNTPSQEETSPKEQKEENKAKPIETTTSNTEQAKLAIDEAIKNATLAKHPATWYYRGVIYHRLLKKSIISENVSDLLKEILRSYHKTKELSLPNNQFHSFAIANIIALWDYYFDKGIRYYKQEAFDEALKSFIICTTIRPEAPKPLLYSAIVYHASKEPEKALEKYNAYVEKTGADVAVYRAIGHIHYHQLKNMEQAIDVLNTALKRFPFDNELLEEKISIYKKAIQTGAYETALIEDIEKKAPTDEASLHNLYEYAYLLEATNRIEEAIAYYKKILRKNPTQSNTLCQLGLLWYNKAIQSSAVVYKWIKKSKKTEENKPAHFLSSIGIGIKPKLTPLLELPLPNIPNRRNLLQLQKIFHGASWVIYNRNCGEKNHEAMAIPLKYVIESHTLAYTSPLYGCMIQKIAHQVVSNQLNQAIMDVENRLKMALYYLYPAYKKDKKNKIIAQALYFTYYHLKRYRSATHLYQTMRKQKLYVYASEDPFREEK